MLESITFYFTIFSLEVLSEEESVDCLDDSDVSENISGDDEDDDGSSEKSGSDKIFIVSVKRDISS